MNEDPVPTLLAEVAALRGPVIEMIEAIDDVSDRHGLRFNQMMVLVAVSLANLISVDTDEEHRFHTAEVMGAIVRTLLANPAFLPLKNAAEELPP